MSSLKTVIAAALCLVAVSVGATNDPFANPVGRTLADPAGGATATRFLPVAEAYHVSLQPDSGVVHVRWQIAPGYYLYHHGFQVWRNGQDITDRVALPDGIHKTDPYFGKVEVYYHTVSYDVPVAAGTDSLVLTLQSQGCADAGLCYPPYRQRFDVDFTNRIVSQLPIAGTPTATAPGPTRAIGGLALALTFALLGGLILNLMPCVLPVLALKALAFANTGDRAERHRHAWAYTAGVVLSFLVVAAALLALRAAGESIGWGFQLQSPWFVAGLIYLFVALALALAGVRDIGASFMGIGEHATRRNGYAGSFFTGALAVVVASPCTAPFMGTALGYAATRPAAVALAVFALLGIGMALPYLLLGYLPRLVRWLPRPGPWMVRLREFLAFPLLATAIWLLWVLMRQTSATAAAIVLAGALVVALAMWLPGTGWVARAGRIALLVAALGALQLPVVAPATSAGSTAADHVAQPFSEARLQALRRQGKAVFVNFTADWCITCLANEAAVLHTVRVRDAFKRNDVTYLKADWTRYDPAIATALAHYGRSGIPLYLWFPPRVGAAAVILPQVLTTKRLLAVIEPDKIRKNAEIVRDTAANPAKLD